MRSWGSNVGESGIGRCWDELVGSWGALWHPWGGSDWQRCSGSWHDVHLGGGVDFLQAAATSLSRGGARGGKPSLGS